MTDRSEQIPLSPDLLRCVAMAGCADQRQCARRMASIPQGAPLGDYSFNRVAGEVCQWYLPIVRRTEPEPVKREVKPWPSL